MRASPAPLRQFQLLPTRFPATKLASDTSCVSRRNVCWASYGLMSRKSWQKATGSSNPSISASCNPFRLIWYGACAGAGASATFSFAGSIWRRERLLLRGTAPPQSARGGREYSPLVNRLAKRKKPARCRLLSGLHSDIARRPARAGQVCGGRAGVVLRRTRKGNTRQGWSCSGETHVGSPINSVPATKIWYYGYLWSIWRKSVSNLFSDYAAGRVFRRANI